MVVICSWQSAKTQPGAQIDLLLDRNDGIINLCEMKYTQGPFILNDAELQELYRKRDVFRTETNSKKALHLTLVTASDVHSTSSAGEIQALIPLDSLF